MCMQTEKFFELTREEQAIEVKRLYEAQQGMSSWLAANERSNDSVSIPRNIASRSAGWEK